MWIDQLLLQLVDFSQHALLVSNNFLYDREGEGREREREKGEREREREREREGRERERRMTI